ncbi:MAG TPA: hypothetical protein VLY46_04340 [Usitatibacter sp.]|nr:hypothetical protein [Usitatibacter sp.]
MGKGPAIALAVLVVAAAAGAMWWNRRDHASIRSLEGLVHAGASGCSAAPLARDEAVRRAEARLGKFSASLGLRERFSESSARFDNDSRSWIVTFRNPECMVMMVVDRCHANDLGGTTDCHAG